MYLQKSNVSAILMVSSNWEKFNFLEFRNKERKSQNGEILIMQVSI